jgi:DNA polymerase
MGRKMKSPTDVVKDIYSALEFYHALGFDLLPVRISLPEKAVLKKSPGKRGTAFYGKEILLRELRKEIGECTRCKLSRKRTNIVFGEGNPKAGLMFIGEGPGREEDLQARPFVGDAGKVLNSLIEKMGFQRTDTYIANIVKCRPPMNRDPEPDEITACRGFLERQIEIISPKVIMTLGRIAALTFLDNPKLRIGAARGKFHDYHGIPLMPTFHPAYLIRNPKDKWLTWNDALQVLKVLKGPNEDRNTDA